jgi:hypothetical protein
VHATVPQAMIQTKAMKGYTPHPLTGGLSIGCNLFHLDGV